MKTIRVGTRPSPLAIRQVEEIKVRLPLVDMDIIRIHTQGDRDKVSSLIGKEESNFFTHEIEQALIYKKIDAAIHSAKDLEAKIPDELMIIAMTKTISPFECLLSSGALGLDELPKGSAIGTSSQNRRDAVLYYRPDLIVKEIRGDIDQRLGQLDNEDFDAIIVAHAALIRLGYEDRIAQIIPEDVIKPHPLQGRLAIEIRRDRPDLIKIFRSLHER